MATAIREDVGDDERAEAARQDGNADHPNNEQPGDEGQRQEHDEQREKFVNPRDAAMQAIAAKNREAVERELGIEPEPRDEAGDQVSRQLDDEPIVLAPTDLSKYRVKTKINGVDGELSLDEAMRQVQKATAADQRLEEANRLLAEARTAEAAALARVTAAAPAATPPAAPPPAATGKGKEFYSALFEGDEDKAASLFDAAVEERVNAAVAKINEGRDDKIVATPELIEAVGTTLRQQQVVNDALVKSRNDYPDLYADPTMEQLGAMKINAKVAEGKPFVDALAEVGAEMATSFKWKAPTPGRREPNESDRERDKKLNRKAGLDSLPAANARRVSTTENEGDEPTDENQRAARGIADIIANRPGQGIPPNKRAA